MLPDHGHISRQRFLQAIAVLGLSACAPFYPTVKYFGLMVKNPKPERYNPILDELIDLVLPFSHPDFPPITAETVRLNIAHYFPLTEERQEPFQRAFILFNDIQLYPHALPAIVNAETEFFEHFEELSRAESQRKVDQYLDIDQQQFARFEHDFGRHESFLAAPEPVKSAYFSLWGASSYNIRRLFYNSAKGIINACAYNQNEMWDAIGYGGHFDSGLTS